MNETNKEGKDEEDDSNDDINEDDDDAEENNDDKNESETNSKNEDDRRAGKTKNIMKKTKFAMTFRDIEDSSRPFEKDEKYPVCLWIIDFEEAAELFKFSDIQKLVFAKRLLRDLAKLFIQGERGIDSRKRALGDPTGIL